MFAIINALYRSFLSLLFFPAATITCGVSHLSLPAGVCVISIIESSFLSSSISITQSSNVSNTLFLNLSSARDSPMVTESKAGNNNTLSSKSFLNPWLASESQSDFANWHISNMCSPGFPSVSFSFLSSTISQMGSSPS